MQQLLGRVLKAPCLALPCLALPCCAVLCLRPFDPLCLASSSMNCHLRSRWYKKLSKLKTLQ